MDLLLEREYWPGGTSGKLYLDGEIFSLTVESPTAHFLPLVPCIPEGIYELDLTVENHRPKLILFKTPNGMRKAFKKQVEIGLCSGLQHIVLVSAITDEGKGIADPVKFRTLKNRVGQILKRDQKATLEIRSCPDQALNLTYHQIEWMD